MQKLRLLILSETPLNYHTWVIAEARNQTMALRLTIKIDLIGPCLMCLVLYCSGMAE